MAMDTPQIPKDPTNPQLLEAGVPDWPLIIEGALADAELHAATTETLPEPTSGQVGETTNATMAVGSGPVGMQPLLASEKAWMLVGEGPWSHYYFFATARELTFGARDQSLDDDFWSSSDDKPYSDDSLGVEVNVFVRDSDRGRWVGLSDIGWLPEELGEAASYIRGWLGLHLLNQFGLREIPYDTFREARFGVPKFEEVALVRDAAVADSAAHSEISAQLNKPFSMRHFLHSSFPPRQALSIPGYAGTWSETDRTYGLDERYYVQLEHDTLGPRTPRIIVDSDNHVVKSESAGSIDADVEAAMRESRYWPLTHLTSGKRFRLNVWDDSFVINWVHVREWDAEAGWTWPFDGSGPTCTEVSILRGDIASLVHKQRGDNEWTVDWVSVGPLDGPGRTFGDQKLSAAVAAWLDGITPSAPPPRYEAWNDAARTVAAWVLAHRAWSSARSWQDRLDFEYGTQDESDRDPWTEELKERLGDATNVLVEMLRAGGATDDLVHSVLTLGAVGVQTLGQTLERWMDTQHEISRHDVFARPPERHRVYVSATRLAGMWLELSPELRLGLANADEQRMVRLNELATRVREQATSMSGNQSLTQSLLAAAEKTLANTPIAFAKLDPSPTNRTARTKPATLTL